MRCTYFQVNSETSFRWIFFNLQSTHTSLKVVICMYSLLSTSSCVKYNYIYDLSKYFKTKNAEADKREFTYIIILGILRIMHVFNYTFQLKNLSSRICSQIQFHNEYLISMKKYKHPKRKEMPQEEICLNIMHICTWNMKLHIFVLWTKSFRAIMNFLSGWFSIVILITNKFSPDYKNTSKVFHYHNDLTN